MIAMLAGFLFSPRPDGWQAWIPGVLYSIAVLIDFLDGYLARVTHYVTRLGEALDITLDGLGVLAATLLIVQYGQAPWWYILVGGARYLYLAALWLLQRSGKPRFDAPPNILRRGLAGLQMGFILVALWPVFSPPGTHLAAIAFGIQFLAHFIFDWLVVSGRLTESMLRRWYFLVPLAVNWLPVGLRACVVVYMLGVIRRAGLIQDAWVFLEMGAALLIIFGAAGRIAAILGLAALGLEQVYTLLSGVQQGMIFVYTAVLILGTGALSAWKPEKVLYSQRAGEGQRHLG
jgi:CDP-diacylglycerol--glycerol-3-phosphate 3-phosphatidyltransferase